MSVRETIKATAVLKLVVPAVLVLSAAGCAVNEEPGNGTQLTLTEPQTKRQYYLYKPAGYDPNKRYPLVMALHCIKPFDNAQRQIKEWESTADKYGFIVAAPVLATANPVPLWFNHVDSTMKRDQQVVMNVLDEVLRDTSADPNWVFISSLSSGGPLMYYVANKYPNRFAGLAARGCWFNENILSEENARKMAKNNFRVMIQYAEYDDINIKIDSWKSIRWHKKMGFNVKSVVIGQTLRLPGLGHMEGTVPDKAGEFFSRCIEAGKSK
ncbi:MAG: hypothetical protein GWP14_09370 [Actinobacteria bacterium]|nr:hypothetical protein [Actinomycetota bacterium]